MEQQQWPTKFQQSGTSEVDGIDTIMNNGNSNESLLQIADNKTCNNEEKCDKDARLQQKFENEISEESRTKIQTILNEVNMLLPVEKLVLYLKLPTESKESIDPLRQPLNPLGSRSEISQTIMWIKTHLEEDPDISLQKKGVYDEYKTYCEQNNIKNLSTADFGKVMKQVYPKVRPRRLGTRGNSQYCYSGLRKRIKLSAPLLPDLSDKPQSTETICYPSDLMAAAWIIIKEWAECQLGINFESFQALAYHLITKSSIGIGTKAADLIKADANRYIKGDALTSYNNICTSKHKEMQLQLQRKIQQKTEVSKEHKRKLQLQSPKSDLKSRNKKCKIQQQISTSSTSSPTAANENNNTSPSQGLQTVCDKSLQFTNLQALPDFSSFQKPVSDIGGNSCDVTVREDNGFGSEDVTTSANTSKVAIPRLNPKQSPVPSNKRVKNANKYKTIQPKPEPCDIAYNPQLTSGTSAGDNRSQEGSMKCRKSKQKKEDEIYNVSPLIEDPQSVILSRERLESVSKVSKDDLDDYLGTGNSQENEEELIKYFPNNNSQVARDDTKKINQLRQLLEQHNNHNIQQPGVKSANKPLCKQNSGNKGEIGFHLQTSGNAKRRVSFDEPVPPSPNTRRKYFSFTPISPGPHSPNGRQSKCSSTNASPFVSPRNTPVPRARGNSHPYITNQNQATNNANSRKQIKNIKVKPDIELGLNTNYKPHLAMSAPPSPRPSLLHDILHNEIPYQPKYVQTQNTSSSTEVSQFLANNIQETSSEIYRSQSVPLRTHPNQYYPQCNFESNTSTQNEFNEIDSFSTTDNINVNKIMDEIDNTPLNIIENNDDLATVLNNHIDYCNAFNKQPNLRWPNRSQSFDYDDTNSVAKCPTYRSVPSTPIPYNKPKIEQPEKIYVHNSRSYPSTPLTNEQFNYNPSNDYLLNGQQIKEKPSSTLDVNQINYLENETKDLIYSDIIFSDTNITNDDLITDNKTNFNFDGQMGDNFTNKSINLDENCDIIGTDYFKGVSDVNGS